MAKAKSYICIRECIMFRPWFTTPAHVQPRVDEQGRPIEYSFLVPPPEHLFREVGKEAAPAQEPAEEVEGPTKVVLEKKSRAELEKIAELYAVPEPQKAANKAELVEAILLAAGYGTQNQPTPPQEPQQPTEGNDTPAS